MASPHISYSEISDYRTCPHKHRLAWKDRWRPAVAAPAPAKGTLFHQVMAQHYRTLQATQNNDLFTVMPTPETLLAAADIMMGDNEHAELVHWMYEGYLEMWGTDPQWRIVEVEQRDSFWLPTAWGSRSHTLLVTVTDLVVEDEMERLWLVDHKTGANLPNEFELDLDDQFTLYQWGLNQQGRRIHGIIYNSARTQRNKTPMLLTDRFRRLPLYRTDEQCRNTAIDAWRTARRAAAAKPGTEERALGAVPCLRPWRCEFAEACLWARKGGDEEDFLASSGFTKQLSHS